jgi:hypothetical protein
MLFQCITGVNVVIIVAFTTTLASKAFMVSKHIEELYEYLLHGAGYYTKS